MHELKLKKMLLRSYIRYMLEEVTLLPKKDFVLDILGERITFVATEKKKIPRFIARIIKKHGLGEIAEETERRKLIAMLPQLSSSEESSPRLTEVSQYFFCELLDIIAELGDEEQKKIIPELSKIIGLRARKILHRLYTKRVNGLDIIEQEYFKSLLDYYDKFSKIFTEDLVGTIKKLRREIFGVS